jgi:hypothetical protein
MVTSIGPRGAQWDMGGKGGDRQFRGGDVRVGGSLFSRRKGRGYRFFQLGRRIYTHLDHFLELLGHRRHRNAQKSLKQAVWDHFELILGTFCDFFHFHLFSLILVDFFYLIGELFERVGGTTFLAERVGDPLNSDLRPTMQGRRQN